MANHHTREKPEITAEQKEELGRWARRPKTAQALAFRARIVLACESEANDMAIAAQLGTTRETVGKWRRRFIERRLRWTTRQGAARSTPADSR